MNGVVTVHNKEPREKKVSNLPNKRYVGACIECGILLKDYNFSNEFHHIIEHTEAKANDKKSEEKNTVC